MQEFVRWRLADELRDVLDELIDLLATSAYMATARFCISACAPSGQSEYQTTFLPYRDTVTGPNENRLIRFHSPYLVALCHRSLGCGAGRSAL